MVEYQASTKSRYKRAAKWAVLLIGLFGIVFGVSFLYFRSQQQLSSRRNPEQSLPPTKLIDSNGVELNDQTLRRGKAILVFIATDCKACDTESEFLKRVYGNRRDVNFYAIVSFGSRESLKNTANKYPFGIYLDGGGLASKLNINRVPIKVFVNEGQIEKTWGGATSTEQAQSEFIQWLESVQ